MWNKNVCRLCLSEKDLFCVLEKRDKQNDNLEQIILITTGVEILKDDVVPKKICGNCRKVTVKMLEFRERALKTDKYLKDRYAEYLKKNPQTDNVVAPTDNSIATTSMQSKDASNPNKTQSPTKLHLHQKIMTMNPTVTNIFTLNPSIKLPTNILSYNVDPSVWMELDAVENYFIRNKLDMRKAVQAALKSSKAPISNKQKESLPNKVVNPISIKFSNINSKFQVISKDTIKRKQCEVDETTKSDKPSKIKRRRLSSSDFGSDTPTLLDTLQLKPKENVHVCHICHSVQNCSYTLRLHMKEHFRCNFCKSKFKLALRKEEHEKTCVVKHMLTSEVYVRLKKIDVDPEAIKKYPVLDKTQKTTKSSCADIIVLSDDDDDDDQNKRENNDKKNVESDNGNLKSNAPLKLSSDNSVQYFSTGLVRPDIKIKDDGVFNNVDMATSDVGVLKQLLKMNVISDLKISIQEQTQTESPDNGNIVKLPDAGTAVLKGLKPQLFAFKVPVRIQKGIFDVSYVTEKTSSVQKHMNLWSDIEPIGLKTIKSNNTQKVPIQLTGPIAQNNVNRISSGTNITKLNSVPKIRPKLPQKPVQIILNQFISPSISNTFSGTTETGTNNARASTPTSTSVSQQHTIYSPSLIVNNSPHTSFKPTGTNNILRTSTAIISMGQQQVFVPNNSGYNNATSVIVGTNHVSSSPPSTITSIPKNNNGTNIYSYVPNEVSLNYASINSTAVPTNVDSQPRQSSNSTAIPHSFISQQRQPPNNTVVTSNSGNQQRLSPNGITVPMNINSQPRQLSNSTGLLSNCISQPSQSSNNTAVAPNLNIQPRQTSNNTAPSTNFISQQRQPPNRTVVTSSSIGLQRQPPKRTVVTSSSISLQRQPPNSNVVTPSSISQQRLSTNSITVPMNFNSQPRQLLNSTMVLSNYISQPSQSSNNTAVTPNYNILPRQTSNNTAPPTYFISQQRQPPNSTVATSSSISQHRLSPNGIAVPMNFNSQPKLLSNSTAVLPNFNIQPRQSSKSTAVPSNSISQQILSPNGNAVQLNFNNQPRQSSNSTVVVPPNFNRQQNHFGIGTGSAVENITPNTNLNIGTNNNVFSDNGTIRPMIRVKNICELK